MGIRPRSGRSDFAWSRKGLTPRDLIPFMGTRAKVSEVLSGKRPLTMQMARALHANLGIPGRRVAATARRRTAVGLDGIEWHRFPLAEMATRLDSEPGAISLAHAEELMRGLIRRAGGEHALPAAFYRKNDYGAPQCEDGPVCAEGLVLGGPGPRERKATAGHVQARHGGSGLPARGREAELVEGRPEAWRRSFSRSTASISVCLAHMPRTHLDGAALQLADGTPVIGLTLRYDRLDNFWFCLLHELAHIGRHLRKNAE